MTLDLATSADIAGLVAEVRALRAEVAELRVAREPGEGLSPRRFGERMGLSLATVYRRLRDGSLPSMRVGSRIVIPATACRPRPEGEVVALAAEARR